MIVHLIQEVSVSGTEIWFLKFDAAPTLADYQNLIDMAADRGRAVCEVYLTERTAHRIVQSGIPDYNWPKPPRRFQVCGLDHVPIKDDLIAENCLLMTVQEKSSLAHP
jgi:hypothetical protein